MKTFDLNDLFNHQSLIDFYKFNALYPDERRLSRWYFGGCSSALAACFTHPLDLIKVYQQTRYPQEHPRRIVKIGRKIVHNNGFRGLYSGISAAMLRQMTYASSRFVLYDGFKQKLVHAKGNLLFCQKVVIAGISGGIAGFIGTPGDVVNVRMQHDIKLPEDSRRNYKNVIDGLYKIIRYEGITPLFRFTLLEKFKKFLAALPWPAQEPFSCR